LAIQKASLSGLNIIRLRDCAPGCPKALSSRNIRTKLLALPLAASAGALGIVYGDTGTSPLYALRKAVKAASADGPPTSAAVLGVVSLIIWALLLIVSLKYAILILRADNRGEGGILALLALLGVRRSRPGTWRGRILVLGLVGAALRDGAITPAISVPSAVEGLKVDAPHLGPAILSITLAILVGLFLVHAGGPASSQGSAVPSCWRGSW
jgi:KUP system potassium uptake protein